MPTRSREVFNQSYYLAKLRKLGVSETKDGRPIEQLEIDELAWEYAVAKMKIAKRKAVKK